MKKNKSPHTELVRWFEDISIDDVGLVGGKNASLGEMVRSLTSEGVNVPDGFATTSAAYRYFVGHNGFEDEISALLASYERGSATLRDTGSAIRRLIMSGDIPEDLVAATCDAYAVLSRRYGQDETDVAVRSSATAEDLPHASFAGQQETYLSVVGTEQLLDTVKRCFASLFTDRAITYRELNGFDHAAVALSVGIQKMVRSDRAGAGVMFTLDTDSGFPDVILINAAWGLGENVVKGSVNPDQYVVHKPLLQKADYRPIIERRVGTKALTMVYMSDLRPDDERGIPVAQDDSVGSEDGYVPTTINLATPEVRRRALVLTDDEILTLGRWALEIERQYNRPMDIEWAKDGETGEMFIVQARPETVVSQQTSSVMKTYTKVGDDEPILTGSSIGSSVAGGTVRRVFAVDDLASVVEGDVIVTNMTDPDWVPAMRRAAAVVTNLGGRTCHAAIVSRELGIPAVVGTEVATEVLTQGQAVTVSCAEGEEGRVYDGEVAFQSHDVDISDLPTTRTLIMLNMAAPDASFRWWRLPSEGIGLARMEFIVGQWIKVHPMALVKFDELPESEDKRAITELTAGYANPEDYFVDRLASGVAKLAASQYPRRVILRMSDFKTNEYAHLIGGGSFEPDEENPMLGWRGASRYYSPDYREGFALECRAVKKVRDEMGFANVAVMIPFCRTPAEADDVLIELAGNGLVRGDNGLEIYLMCEIPSNVVLAKEFASRFDGFSIGSNDLTQLALGVDRDSSRLAYLFDERNEAVLRMIRSVVKDAHEAGVTVGICGQAPSDYPDFAEFLVGIGIDSMSLNPDSFVSTLQRVAETEAELLAQPV